MIQIRTKQFVRKIQSTLQIPSFQWANMGKDDKMLPLYSKTRSKWSLLFVAGIETPPEASTPPPSTASTPPPADPPLASDGTENNQSGDTGTRESNQNDPDTTAEESSQGSDESKPVEEMIDGNSDSQSNEVLEKETIESSQSEEQDQSEKVSDSNPMEDVDN